MTKSVKSTTQLHSYVIPQILQVRLQKYVNCELPDFKLDLEKAEEPWCQHPMDHRKSKNIPDCGKFWKRLTTWSACWEICMQVRKQQLEMDMEQQTGSKSGKEYVKVYIVTLLI